MGFVFRKSFKAGPFRATVSKSGISYSAGIPGARITRRADGRIQGTASVPGSGLRYTTSTAGSDTSRPSPQPSPQAPAGRPLSDFDLEQTWRNTGRPLPVFDSAIKPDEAMRIAGIMTLLGEPGEQTQLLVRINMVSPLRNVFIVTSQRLVLLHSRSIVRDGSRVFAVNRNVVNAVTTRRKLLLSKLVIHYSGALEEIAGGIKPASEAWLRQVTHADPMFRFG